MNDLPSHAQMGLNAFLGAYKKDFHDTERLKLLSLMLVGAALVLNPSRDLDEVYEMRDAVEKRIAELS